MMTDRELQLLENILEELRLLRKAIEDSNCVSVPGRKFISLKEASKLSGLSVRRLREYIKAGVLTRYGSKRRTLIFIDELEEAIKNGFTPDPSNADSRPGKKRRHLKPVRLARKPATS